MSTSETVKHAHDLFEKWPQLRDLSLNAVAAELAAAEERGRRRGVEEAMRVCRAKAKRMRDYAAETLDEESVPRAEACADQADDCGDAIAALAPRVPHASEGPPCAGCGHAKWRHQYGSKEHAFCSEPLAINSYCRCENYLAPRDSAHCFADLCSLPNGHVGVHMAKAPRDSGKE